MESTSWAAVWSLGFVFKSVGAPGVCVSTGGGHLAPALGNSWVQTAGEAVRGVLAPGRQQMAFRCLLAPLLHFLASPPHPPGLGDVGSSLLWAFKGLGSEGSVRGKIKAEVPFLVV